MLVFMNSGGEKKTYPSEGPFLEQENDEGCSL